MLQLSPHLKARLVTPLKIGALCVNSRVLQSPLSGVTDLVFRRLVRRYAQSSMLYTEMTHALRGCLKSVVLCHAEERSISVYAPKPRFYPSGKLRLRSV